MSIFEAKITFPDQHIVIIWFIGATWSSLPVSASDEYFLLNFKPPPPLWHLPGEARCCFSHPPLRSPPTAAHVWPFITRLWTTFWEVNLDYRSSASLKLVFVCWFLSEQSSKLANSHSHLGSKTIMSISPFLSDVEMSAASGLAKKEFFLLALELFTANCTLTPLKKYIRRVTMGGL